MLAAWWTVSVLLATSWWLVPLLYQGRYGFNFLPYIEQAANTTQTMSAAAILRGSGNWVAYLNFGQPWLTAGSVMVGSAWAVAGGAVAAAAGLAGLARRDLPEAGWLRGTAAVAALWALTGYAGPLGGPLHQQVQALLNGPLAALRNVSKIEPALAVVLALGIAHVLSRGVWPRRGRPPRRLRRRGGGPGRPGPALSERESAAARLVQPGTQLLAAGGHVAGCAQQDRDHPGGTGRFSRHLHLGTADRRTARAAGQLTVGAAQPGAVQRRRGQRPAERRRAGHRVGHRLAGPGQLSGRAGIRYVLVRNDTDPAQLGYTPPTVVHAALEAVGVHAGRRLRPAGAAGPVGQGTALQVEAIEPEYPPVEIFQAANPAERPTGPAAVLPAASTTLVDGGPASLLQLEAQGMLGDRAAVIAGQDTSTDPPATQQDVTDGLRRADTVFGLPNNNTSYTYTATGTIPPDDPQGAGGQPPRQLLPAGTAGHQTVAVLTGAASVTASSAGSWLWEVPQGDPVNAFDGNPSTAWTEASPGSADGQWIQINFTHPLHLSGPLTVRLLDDIPRPVATRLVITTAAGRAATGTRVTGAPQPVSVPSGTTSWLRITIAATRGGTPGGPGAGISEVTIPGVRVTRFLQPSQDQAGPAPSFSFHRETSTTFGLPGAPPEPALDRTFTVPAAQRFTVSASVTAVPGAALNALLDRVGSGTPAQLQITAGSTFGSLPALRPQNLLENGGNGWVAAGPRCHPAPAMEGAADHRRDRPGGADRGDRRRTDPRADHQPGRDP